MFVLHYLPLCVLETDSITEFFSFTKYAYKWFSRDLTPLMRWIASFMSLSIWCQIYPIGHRVNESFVFTVFCSKQHTKHTIHSIFTYRVPHPRTLFKPGMIELSGPIIYVSKIIKNAQKLFWISSWNKYDQIKIKSFDPLTYDHYTSDRICAD